MKKIDLPNDHGYLKLFIRELFHDDRRYSYETIHIPYIRYNHHHFRKY